MQGVKTWVIKVAVIFYVSWKKCFKPERLFTDAEELFAPLSSAGIKVFINRVFFSVCASLYFFNGQGCRPVKLSGIFILRD
ncbi:MAG: hypothetical protein C4554_10390 [Dethiobacter sp.]|nr:MAG: hypothetical protein C4554_10390 [Dethiobacter sp.]